MIHNKQSLKYADRASTTPARRGDIPEQYRHDPVGYLNRRYRRQAGATVLTGWSLALLLAGIASAAAFLMFSSNATDAKTENLGTELSKVVGQVQTNYQGQYDKLSNAAIIRNSFFAKTSTMSVSGTTINVRPGNGTLSVAPGTLTTANDSASWTLTNIPDSGCAQAVSGIASLAGQLTVNNTIVKAPGTPFNMSLVSCTNNDSNTVVFLVG